MSVVPSGRGAGATAARSSAPARRAPPVAVLDRVRADLRVRPAGSADLAVLVDEALRAHGTLLGPVPLAETVRAVADELVGAGALQPWLDDPLVTDVLVNAPQEVWVERAGALVRVPVDLGTPADVRELAVRLAAAAGRRLDDAAPTVDARLPDGTRLHAVLPPLAEACTVLSLRVVRPRGFTLPDLVAARAVVPPLVPLLEGLVRSRSNVLVSGATGAGKTTLLAALLSLVPHDERIVLVEEAGELVADHPHVVRLTSRPANVDGAGGVGLADLVRQALRMRPDRIVLGECRGAEVREVLAALNTGHEGGCATLHANTAADVPARLEALAALAGLDRAAVAAQAASAVDAVLHVRRVRRGADAGRRYLAEVAVVDRGTDGGLRVTPAVVVGEDGTTRTGPGARRLSERIGSEP
ncbi:TadA family conjugal transfer-associated ATPase [Cellulomonas sp. zg-ZUI199]|uniref:TadA family conjugal transfer-associated ATPase n=1 Tax=Cellulomonas wangleii TaxID=2816956 RepID=A0ABX8D274_9CELL|nr:MULTISPECIES: TadA family conjugal transfer-associated ATPase [Cellulomonas]MBO0899504.1 TadA family conjugal transfer-associated ATPase [Cellulomonas sp. zg-ZUI22]MBO0923215.1 TadA family conjugal transfer-associated ATPase [Cellulomonas wangleii]QVI61584.1 TadA family conjugal transfer-associated ATPase [Cellulomonas wangleii]